MSDGEFQTVTSYYKLIPGRNSMRVNSSSIFFMRTLLHKVTFVTFGFTEVPLGTVRLCSSNRMVWSTPAQYRSVNIASIAVCFVP